MSAGGTDPRALYEMSRAAFQRGDLARAIPLADQLVALTGAAPDACGWAARLRLAARQPQIAIEVIQQGLAQSKSAALYCILGQAHDAQADLDLAEAAYKIALRLQPDHTPSLFHYSALLVRIDREFEALELLRRAVALSPNPSRLFLLARLELSFSNSQAAYDAASKALSVDPGDAMGHTVAARSLMDLGRDDEALGHWQRATELAAAGDEEVDLVHARFLLEQGRFEPAAAILGKMAKAHPERALPRALLADAKRATDSDMELIAEMQNLAADHRTAAADRMTLDYAVGKSLDDLGRYEDAMRHFDRANLEGKRSVDERGGFDQSKYAAIIEARKEVFSTRNIRRAAGLGLKTETPIFVVGMVRSGTTLIEQILARHPQVKGAGEQKFWIALDGKLVNFENRRIQDSVLAEAAGTYLRLLNEYLGTARRVVNKQPGNLLMAGALHLAYPDAHIIYMHRNLLDNAVSIWTTHIRSSVPFLHDKANLAFALRRHETLMNHWSDVLPADRFMTLSYESLVLERETTTRRVLEFCGLDWSDACLSPEKVEGRVVTPSVWQVRQPVYRTSIGRWRHYEPWLGELRQLAGDVG